MSAHIFLGKGSRQFILVTAIIHFLAAFSAGAEDANTIAIGPMLFGPRANEISISWQTTANSTDHRVELGISKSLGTSVTWLASPATCCKPIAGKPTAYPAIRITKLQPGKTYFYRVVTASSASPVYSFQLPTGDTRRIVAWGDSDTNTSYFSSKTVPLIKKLKPDMLWSPGGLASVGFKYDSWYNEFFTPMKEVLARTPILAARGSGDGSYPLSLALFPMLGNNHYYGVNVGSARLLVLDSKDAISSTSDQGIWLAKELTSPAWQNAKLRIVMFYAAPYANSGKTKTDYGWTAARQYLMADLLKSKTDLIISAKHHLYERGALRRDDGGRCHLLVIGGGAADLHTTRSSDWPFLHISHLLHHVVKFEIKGDKLLAEAIDIDTGVVFDEFMIESESPTIDAKLSQADVPKKKTVTAKSKTN